MDASVQASSSNALALFRCRHWVGETSPSEPIADSAGTDVGTGPASRAPDVFESRAASVTAPDQARGTSSAGRWAPAGIFSADRYVPRARVAGPLRLEDREGQPILSVDVEGILLGHTHLGLAIVEVVALTSGAVDGQGEPLAPSDPRLAELVGSPQPMPFQVVQPELAAGASSGAESAEWAELVSSADSIDALEARAAAPKLFEGIRAEDVHETPQVLLDAISLALEQPVVGSITKRAIIEAIEARGHDVFLEGGGVRDSVHALARGEPLTAADIVERFMDDFDMVTSAPPSLVRAIVREFAGPELSDDELFWTPESIQRYGMVGVGQRRGGADITSLAVRNTARGTVLGQTLRDDSGRRDFRLNSLYIALTGALGRRHRLIDPTGGGLADARELRLTPIPDVSEPAEAQAWFLESFRFIKFRARGYVADDATVAVMADHARLVVPTWSPRQLAINVLRIAPGSVESPATLDPWFTDILDTMRGDGMSELVETHLVPAREAVEAELERRRRAAAASGAA